jgi:hypothetical protein
MKYIRILLIPKVSIIITIGRSIKSLIFFRPIKIFFLATPKIGEHDEGQEIC